MCQNEYLWSKRLIENTKQVINHTPNDKILDWSKLKAFAEDKLKVAQMMKLLLDRVENIEGKK